MLSNLLQVRPIGPGGGLAGKQRFSPLDDGVWIFQESGVLVAILDAIMYRLVDLGPGVLVEADDLQSRMILAESAADRVADVHDIVLLLPWSLKLAPAEVFKQGFERYMVELDRLNFNSTLKPGELTQKNQGHVADD